jgi:peptidoglycan/LPS O-acetylase OafA/YrhL
MKPERNQAIEGLRGLSAVLVVVSHLNGIAMAKGYASQMMVWLDTIWLEHVGLFSVCAFFSISGYLITQSLERAQSPQRFALNRIKRLMPLFVVLQLILFPVALYIKDDLQPFRKDALGAAMHFVSNFFLLPGVFDLPIAQENAWSLSFEALFYVCAGLIFFGRGRAVTWIGVGIAVCFVLFRPYAIFFAIGAAAHFVYRDRPTVPAWLRPGPVGLIALVIAYLAFPAGWKFVPPMPGNLLRADHPVATDAQKWGWFWQTLWLWIPFTLGGAVFFLAVVYQSGWLSRLLQIKPLQFLGAISYSLYLVHPIIVHGLDRYLLRAVSHAYKGSALFCVGLALSIGVGYLGWRFIEGSLTRFLFRQPVALG